MAHVPLLDKYIITMDLQRISTVIIHFKCSWASTGAAQAADEVPGEKEEEEENSSLNTDVRRTGATCVVMVEQKLHDILLS